MTSGSDERSHSVSDLIPFVHVADIARSIDFYRLLGFEVRGTHVHDGRLDWASLASDQAQLMLARADSEIDRRRQLVLFYLYAEDLDALRDHLVAHDLSAGPIRDGTPGPARELSLSDPDGYCLMVAETERRPTASDED
jgi:catechol 2,3-dioxygenase-like lactoylglutathione lyase family enzyme